MSSLTVLINTKNEAHNIKDAIKSVKKIAQEIIVVDMKSDDETVSIAQKSGANVISYDTDHGFADPARNFALEKVTTEWVLFLDADERIDASLADTILELLKADDQDVYYLPRKNIMFGEWIEHTGWWPDYQPRLFRHGYLSWPGKVHAQPIVKGRITHIDALPENAITHYNYKDISHFIKKLNRYTSLAADAKSEKEKKKPISSAQVLSTFYEEFLSRLFAQEGIKDGVRGVGLSVLQSMYELTTYLKTWEMGGHMTADFDEKSAIRALHSFKKDLNYWIADYEVKNSSGLIQLFWKARRKFKI